MQRSVFYDAVRREPFGGSLSESQVDGMEAILDEAERRGTPVNRLAYVLATTFLEVDRTMQPIKEYGSLAYFMRMYDKSGSRPKVAKELGNTIVGDGAKYCGRGLVMITGRRNYNLASRKLGVDFLTYPHKVMEPRYAVKILFDGMESGWFTGHDLDDHIDDIDEGDDEDFREYVAARRIVNGKDRAERIAKYALAFEKAIRASHATDAPMPEVAGPDKRPSPLAGLLRAFLDMLKLIKRRR